MTIKALENKLHTQIPLTKLMQLELIELNDDKLITQAPLDININDKGTAFGGSLSTMTIISSWSLVFLIAQELNIKESNIVIINNTTQFKRPVTKELICHTFKPSKEDIALLKSKLEKKNRGSIKIKSQIIEDEKVCVDFEGDYYITIL